MSSANFLDRAIAVVAPAAAARRIQARHAFQRLAQAGYDGAARGRRTAGWITGNASAAAETISQASALRARSRDLVRNNPYAQRAVTSISQNVVGQGIRAQATSKSKTLNRKIEKLWQEWAETKKCDASGCLTFAGIQELALRTIVESGEVLVRRRNRGSADRLPVPLQLEVLEPDYLDTSRDTSFKKGRGRTIGGIQYSAIGRTEGYWIFPYHPGDQGYGGYDQSNLVRWDQIAHGFRIDRPGQPRGVPWVAPAIIRLHDLDGYEDAHMMRQKVAACYAAFVVDADGTPDEDDFVPDQIEPGMIEKLPPGRNVVFGDPPGVESFSEFATHNLRAIAVAYGITYESLVGDYSKTNFSSGRMGHLEFQRNIHAWRWNMLIPQVCDPVWDWFIEQATVAGLLPTEALGVKAKWTPPRREMVEPMKEMQASQLAVRSGFQSLPGAMREHGHEPDQLLEEIADFNEKMDKLGIKLETGPLNASSSSSPEPEADGIGAETTGNEPPATEEPHEEGQEEGDGENKTQTSD